jgi:hypothetical protein
MRLIRVGAGALVFGAFACSDPVSHPKVNEATVDQTASANLQNGNAGVNSAVNPRISVLDDCKPGDPGWNPTGGCTLATGVVNLDEFNLFLSSPLSQSVVGHPAWRNEPSFVKVVGSATIDVQNDGGRFHTFTKVAQYGGGRVPPLNIGLTPAPECALAPGAPDPTGLIPGASLQVTGLTRGNHRYQCCIHPWMRALVKVS